MFEMEKKKRKESELKFRGKNPKGVRNDNMTQKWENMDCKSAVIIKEMKISVLRFFKAKLIEMWWKKQIVLCNKIYKYTLVIIHVHNMKSVYIKFQLKSQILN